MAIRRLSDVDVRGKRVFIRADLNVPQDDAGRITDDTRIRASLPGIRDVLARGAAVMVTSHLGRPAEGEWTAEYSLAPVATRLGELLGRDIPLVRDWIDGGAWHEALAPGDVVLLENCRMHHARAGDFDPALATLERFRFHINLETRLGEREEVRTKLHFGARTKKFAHEKLEGAF